MDWSAHLRTPAKLSSMLFLGGWWELGRGEARARENKHYLGVTQVCFHCWLQLLGRAPPLSQVGSSGNDSWPCRWVRLLWEGRLCGKKVFGHFPCFSALVQDLLWDCNNGKGVCSSLERDRARSQGWPTLHPRQCFFRSKTTLYKPDSFHTALRRMGNISSMAQ